MKIKLNILMSIVKKNYYRKKIIVIYNNMKYLILRIKYKNVELFDYKNGIKNSKMYSNDIYLSNSFYGISNQISQYSGYKGKICACIEHGVYFGDFISKNEVIDSGLPMVITFSNTRYKHIRENTKKMIYEIGPYINYCTSFYNTDEYKRKLGKVLLVFPSHSIEEVACKYDSKKFIEYIDLLKINLEINEVLVCLYWKDIELGYDEIYKEWGYSIVTAGHRNDKNFLRKLRSFIEIADYTISNSVGTHVGYCISLNKPHQIFTQKIIYKELYSGGNENEFGDKTKENRNIARNEMEEVEEAFSNFNLGITDLQKEICNKYWGLNLIKSQSEMKQILLLSEYITKKTNKTDKSYEKIINEISQKEECTFIENAIRVL